MYFGGKVFLNLAMKMQSQKVTKLTDKFPVKYFFH